MTHDDSNDNTTTPVAIAQHTTGVAAVAFAAIPRDGRRPNSNSALAAHATVIGEKTPATCGDHQMQPLSDSLSLWIPLSLSLSSGCVSNTTPLSPFIQALCVALFMNNAVTGGYPNTHRHKLAL